jgi:(2Fe-2S) ferredoxin
MRSILLISISIISLLFRDELSAQSLAPHGGRVWILNEGIKEGRGSIGFVDFPCGTYRHWDSIPALSTDLKVLDGFLLVAGADGMLRVYISESRPARIFDLPVRKMEVRRRGNQYLAVASCSSPPFVRVIQFNATFNEATVLWQSDTNQAPNETDGVAINSTMTKAYISMNAFNRFGINRTTDNRILVLSLEGEVSFIRHIQVQTNPQALVWGHRNGQTNDSLWVQSLDYGEKGLGISIIDSRTDRLIFSDTTRILSYGGFVYRDGILFNRVNSESFSTEAVAHYRIGRPVTNLFVGSFTALGYSPNFEYLALAQSDYVSTGSVDFADASNQLLQIQTHISPAAFAFEHIRSLSRDPQVIDLKTSPRAEVSFVPSLAGPQPTVRWSDGNTSTTRSFASCGIYMLDVTLGSGCSFTQAIEVQLDERPAFVFSVPDTLTISSPRFTLSSPLSSFRGARWKLDERLELRSPENADEILVEFKGEVGTGWYRYSVEITTEFCTHVFMDSVFIRSSVRRLNHEIQPAIVPYPNPVQESHFMLQGLENRQIRQLSLYSLDGRQLRTWLSQGESYSTAGIEAGLYIVKALLADNLETVVFRLQVN